MANPRRLDFNGFDGFRDNGFIPNPSMIPYIQSSQPNGGKANARNALLLWKRLKFGTKCVGLLCLPKDYQNKRPWVNRRRVTVEEPENSIDSPQHTQAMNKAVLGHFRPEDIKTKNSKFHVPHPSDPPEIVEAWKKNQKLPQ